MFFTLFGYWVRGGGVGGGDHPRDWYTTCLFHGGGLGGLRGSWDANYPCPPHPPHPQGPSANNKLPKVLPSGVHGRLRRPMLHEYQRCPEENLVQFAPQHYP